MQGHDRRVERHMAAPLLTRPQCRTGQTSDDAQPSGASRAGPVLVPAGGAVELLARFSMARQTAGERCMAEADTPASHHIGTTAVDQRRVAAHMRTSAGWAVRGSNPEPAD